MNNLENYKITQAVLVKAGQKLLDFGCGVGTYSIPSAEIIGKGGMVFSVESDVSAIRSLKQNIQSAGLDNIEIVKTNGATNLPFHDNFFDFILLYDVLHDYYFTDSERKIFLNETYMINKKHP